VVAASAALAAIGLGSSSLTGAPLAALAALAIGAIGLYSATPPFWSLPTAFLRGDGAAAGIGLINSVGNLGGVVGPYGLGGMHGVLGRSVLGVRSSGARAVGAGLVVMTVRASKQREASAERVRSARL